MFNPRFRFILGPKGSNFLFFFLKKKKKHIDGLSQIWRNVNTILAPCRVHKEAGPFRRETARKRSNRRLLINPEIWPRCS